MDTTQPDPTGHAVVQLASENVIEVVSFGHITRADFERDLDRMTQLCEDHPRAFGLLWNTSNLDSYEPGNTALALKWVARHVQIRRTAVVTRTQSVASLVHVGRVMIPGLETRSFRFRAEAMEWFSTPLTGRPRTRSGRFKAA